MSYTAFNGTLIVPTDIAKIYTAPRAEITATTVWTEEFWTLKNTLTFDQVQGSKSEINVDQTTTAIAVKYAAGTTTFGFRVPDMHEDRLSIFYNGVAVTNAATIKTDKMGYGFSAALKTVADKMVMVEYTNGWGIIFPHCEMVGSLKKSGEDAWTIDVAGTVLAGDASGEAADFIVLQPTA
jgi:hypothetical protein